VLKLRYVASRDTNADNFEDREVTLSATKDDDDIIVIIIIR
jgi:hypothetical protein